MRKLIVGMLCAAGALSLGACAQKGSEASVERAVQRVNVVDESNLNDIMLTVGDPEQAVAYFSRASKQQPDRLDFKRDLAKSLIRAKRPQRPCPCGAR